MNNKLKIVSLLAISSMMGFQVLAATNDLIISENMNVSDVTLGSGTTNIVVFANSSAESFDIVDGIFTVTNPGSSFSVGSSNASVKTIVISKNGSVQDCIINSTPGTSSITLPVTSGTYTVQPSETTTCSNACSNLAHTATYNAYPTCGAATCSSGYTISGSGSGATCVAQSSGNGGGSYTPPKTTDPLNAHTTIGIKDSDGDGLSDALEIALGLNPNNADTDSDGYNDKLEFTLGYNPNGTGKMPSDNDNDGLSNDLEIALGLNPDKADTDEDGYSDKEELLSGHNPKGTGKSNIDNAFTNKQKGKIFIETEGNGEAWYVNPSNGDKYFLGRPNDAFNLMRKFSLGVKHSFIVANKGKIYSAKYRGKILLDVEDSGKAYYIDANDGKAYSLGNPTNAFEVIRKRGIGIKNIDLDKISTGILQ